MMTDEQYAREAAETVHAFTHELHSDNSRYTAAKYLLPLFQQYRRELIEQLKQQGDEINRY